MLSTRQLYYMKCFEAFEDMSKLMEQARDMVNLSKSITERLRLKKGEITDDEVDLVESSPPSGCLDDQIQILPPEPGRE